MSCYKKFEIIVMITFLVTNKLGFITTMNTFNQRLTYEIFTIPNMQYRDSHTFIVIVEINLELHQDYEWGERETLNKHVVHLVFILVCCSFVTMEGELPTITVYSCS